MLAIQELPWYEVIIRHCMVYIILMQYIGSYQYIKHYLWDEVALREAI